MKFSTFSPKEINKSVLLRQFAGAEKQLPFFFRRKKTNKYAGQIIKFLTLSKIVSLETNRFVLYLSEIERTCSIYQYESAVFAKNHIDFADKIVFNAIMESRRDGPPAAIQNLKVRKLS
jgi:hypothetical protein